MRKVLSGFAEFIKEYNISGMAVAFVMWAKVSELVKSLVEDVVMPALLKPAMEAANVDTLSQLSTSGGILYGKFLTTFIDFAIVAFIVYLMVTYMTKIFGFKNKE